MWSKPYCLIVDNPVTYISHINLFVGGEYLDQREMKRQEAGENCIIKSFITCTLLQV
jgi:hypothetical protein